MRKALLATFVAALFCTTLIAQQKPKANTTSPPAPAPQGRLAVKRVVLYKNGVGYFEHSARIHGTQDLGIDFTTAQLNDVIKSLTVVDMGEGHVSAVRYNSMASLSERLKSLRLPLGEQTSQEDFLSALRGVRVEVRGGNANATGKVLSIERVKKLSSKGDQMEEVTQLSLVTDSDELRTFDLGPATAVRTADKQVGDEVGRYLNLIGSANAKDLRHVTISDIGTGDRDVFVSYISEVPVWKSTYRILLPSKPGDNAILQGWAIVDNTSGDDWRDVDLSLVAGAPQSFVQDISQPYYVRRPVVALPESVMLTPQTHEGTISSMQIAGLSMTEQQGMAVAADRFSAGGRVDGGVILALPGAVPGTAGLQGVVRDPTGTAVPGAEVTIRNEQTGASQTVKADAQGNYRFYNLTAGNSALFVNSPGFRQYALTSFFLGTGRMNEVNPTLDVGAATQTVTVAARAPAVNTQMATVSRVMNNQNAEAKGNNAGDFFEYDLKQKITVDRNQSALVPIIQSHIGAERVTLWNEEPGVPLRALWINNTSGLELDSGTFNVTEQDTFAGEGTLDPIRPGEKRLISYAADPAVRVKVEEDSDEKPVSRVLITNGIMVITHEDRESKTYTIHNSDNTPRQVVIEHPVREDWKLVEGKKPEESSASFYRFRVPVDAGKTAELKVEEAQPEDTRVVLTNLTENDLTVLYDEKRVTPAMEQDFRKILDQKSVINNLDNQVLARQQEIQSIGADQGRIRENMKALKGSQEEKALLERYTKQLDSQEDRLATLRREIGELKEKRDRAARDLNEMVSTLALKETF
jgi:Carboxypeptidase regulatory-like domain